MSRRGFFSAVLRGAALLAIGAGAVSLFKRSSSSKLVWQLDPDKCIQCGRCETNCVLTPSAVKCTQDYPLCGYCRLCFGYYEPDSKSFSTAGENQLCPVGALHRKLVQDPYYEYTINETLCVGCGRCVRGCGQFGNGSLYLQAHHDRCLNCNQCSIAINCPVQAWSRIPAVQSYDLKTKKAPQA
jgi:Na+-translocating ferredoxin:NAD+ oxidoreductase subunit B